MAYPAGDIVLLAMLVRLTSAPGVASTALRLLVGAVILQITADTALAAAPSSSWDYSGALDLLWLGSYVCWGASALHPRMSRLPQDSSYTATRFTRRRLAVLSTAALLPPLTQLGALGADRSVSLWVVVAGSIVLTSLVLARTACAVGEIRVATKQRDRLEEHLFEQASRDALTGLFNRAYMISQIGGALRRGQTSGSATGLLVVNIDGFAVLNRDWGPSAGDAVLKEASRRLLASSEQCPVGRLGDDQFVVLVDGADAENHTTGLAERVLDTLRRPFDHRGQPLHLTVSVGASVSLDAGTEPGQLLQEALIAVRRSESSGSGRIEIFDDFMRREHAHRRELDSSLRRAIADGGLELYYQPVVAAMSGVIDGYEALVRWNDAGHVRSPEEFIAVAESSDLICDIGRWALSEATRQFAAWVAAEPERFNDLTIAVNVSGRHLAGSTIVDDVRRALEASGLPGHQLVLEVTETILIDVPRAVLQLSSLRSLGVTISLDDFGTGFTSVGQLRDLPIDTIKIDKSYFDSTEPGASELIALMTGAAHACGLLVVAEGIERAEQLDALVMLDCDAAQGFLFSRPLRAQDVLAYRGHDTGPQLRVVKDEDDRPQRP
jgi:diguanylate cyclase (GGDEF)-like protein